MQTSGNGRSDRKIFLTTVALQQCLQCRAERHEWSCPLLPTQLLDRQTQRPGQLRINRCTIDRSYRRTLSIRRQFERGQIMQLFQPILTQIIKDLSLQSFTLPDRVICILDGQGGKG